MDELSKQLQNISSELASTARKTPPTDAEADQWIESIDELTNQSTWLRRDLLAEATQLRLHLWGAE